MSWFSFLSTLSSNGQASSTTPIQKYPPVRRKITAAKLNENLKIGDWLYVLLDDLEVGKLYSYNGGIVQSIADDDSYLVVYETENNYQPTYSYIDSDNKLYFRSVTEAPFGSFLEGSYYIYYHYNNIQYIQLSGANYVQSITPINGFKAFEDGNESSESTINKYSNVVLGSSENQRVYSVSYISSPGTWVESKSDNPGNKVLGTFDGPFLKIFGSKNPDSGKASIKIIKTSSAGAGQSVIVEDTVDLFSAVDIIETSIYSVDLSIFMSGADPEEIYGPFMFELTILDEKNISSSGKNVKITKYSFSKNYLLSIGDEEIYEGIIFKSSGVIR